MTHEWLVYNLLVPSLFGFLSGALIRVIVMIIEGIKQTHKLEKED